MGRLEGFVTLISGAASGIGEGIARAFAAEGAAVWVTDIQDSKGAALAREFGAHALYRRLDVRREEDWIGAMEAVRARAVGGRSS